MKRIISTIFCLILIYFFVSPYFTQSIVLGQQIKANCDAVSKEELGKWPNVVYCSAPMYNQTEKLYYYFVYVNKPKNYPNFLINSDGLNGNTFNSEELTPGGTNPDTGEVIDYPVAEWSTDNQNINIRRSGVFLLSGPKNITITFTSNDNYVKFSGIGQCAELALGQSALNAIKMYETYRNMNVTDIWQSWKTALNRATTSQLKSSNYPITYNGQNGVAVSDEILGEIDSKIVDQHGFEKKIALLTKGDKLFQVEDISGISTTVSTANSPATERALTVIEQLIREGKIDGFIDIHSHPFSSTVLSSFLDKGISLDDLATPAIRWYGYGWGGDIAGYRMLQNRFGEDGPKIFGIFAYNKEDPSQFSLRFWKLSDDLPDFYSIPRDYFSIPEDQLNGIMVPQLKPQYAERAGFVKEVFTFSKEDLIITLPGLRPDTIWYDFADIHVTKFYIQEISDIWDDIIDVQDLVSTSAMTKEHGQALLNQYLDEIEWLHGTLQETQNLYPDTPLLPPDRYVSINNVLSDETSPLKQAIVAIKDHNFGESNPTELQNKLISAFKRWAEPMYTEDMQTQNLGFIRMKQLEEAGYHINPEDASLFEKVTERYNSINEKLKIMMTNIKQDDRLRMLLKPGEYGGSWQDLLNPIEIAKNNPLVPLFAVPGFLIGFGSAFEILANNYGDYQAYRYGMVIKEFGVSLLLTFVISLGVGILYTILNMGLTLTFILGVIFASAFFLVIGLLVGFIAGILWFIFSRGYNFNCEYDNPWYEDSNTTVNEHFVSKNDVLHYRYCGIRYCNPAEYTAVLVYSSDSGSNPVTEETVSPFPSCQSVDGRCFDCSVTVTNPTPGNYYYVNAFWASNRTSLYEIVKHDKTERIYVCPNGLVVDKSKNNCVQCYGQYDHTGIYRSSLCEENCGSTKECDEIPPNSLKGYPDNYNPIFPGSDLISANQIRQCDSNCIPSVKYDSYIEDITVNGNSNSASVYNVENITVDTLVLNTGTQPQTSWYVGVEFYKVLNYSKLTPGVNWDSDSYRTQRVNAGFSGIDKNSGCDIAGCGCSYSDPDNNGIFEPGETITVTCWAPASYWGLSRKDERVMVWVHERDLSQDAGNNGNAGNDWWADALSRSFRPGIDDPIYGGPASIKVNIIPNYCADISGPTQGVPDGIVNMRDINYMIFCFNSRPDRINSNGRTWDQCKIADVSGTQTGTPDNVINMRDINAAILQFNLNC